MIGINKSHTLISHLFLLDSYEIKRTGVSCFSDVSFEEKDPRNHNDLNTISNSVQIFRDLNMNSDIYQQIL